MRTGRTVCAWQGKGEGQVQGHGKETWGERHGRDSEWNERTRRRGPGMPFRVSEGADLTALFGALMQS